ncbi:hypothetical protein CapIbe_003232 [Capra ibex]
MTGYGISFPAVSRVSLFLLPFLRSTAYSDVVVTVVAEVQWIPNIVLVSGGRQSDPGPAYLRCSSAVIPPPLPFRLRYPKGGFCLPAPSWPKPYSTGRWARPLPTTTRGHGTHLPARVAAP